MRSRLYYDRLSMPESTNYTKYRYVAACSKTLASSTAAEFHNLESATNSFSVPALPESFLARSSAPG
jgi:hypothetical protein